MTSEIRKCYYLHFVERKIKALPCRCHLGCDIQRAPQYQGSS